MSVLSRRIKICNHILTFWPFSMTKSHKGQVWRPFWMDIFGGHFDFFGVLKLKLFQVYPACFVSNILILPPNPQFSINLLDYEFTLTKYVNNERRRFEHLWYVEEGKMLFYIKIWNFMNTKFKIFWKNLCSFILYWISKCVNTIMGTHV